MAKKNKIITDPYRPPVGELAPNYPPFVIKSSKELPARQGGVQLRNMRETGKDLHVKTTHGVKELHADYYQRNRIIGPSRL
jgi:hypothetical protein